MNLKIVTPNGIVYDDTVSGVSARSITGDIRILNNHIDYAVPLADGKVKISHNGELTGTSGKGVISVYQNKVTIITQNFDWD